MEEQESSYDLYTYESQPYADSRPEHLALIARLRGLSAPDLTSFRCLEIGCAAGNNIIPQAFVHPNSRFVAIDPSQSQVAIARGTAERLHLSNLEFHHTAFEAIGSDLGEFDYIICHGVLSWIPHTLHEALFSFCARSLKDGGLLYISYNSYPGWHVREIVRHALMFHTSDLPPSDVKIDQARQFASFLADNLNGIEFSETQLIKDEFRKASQLPGWYLLHDLLEGHNEPLYFSDVVNPFARQGLRYVGDAELGTMFPQELSQEARKQLYALGRTPEMLEQYLDFVRLRTFRKSIFVKQEVSLTAQLQPSAVDQLYASCAYRVSSKNSARPKGATEYENDRGETFQSSDPLLMMLVDSIVSAMPHPSKVSELDAAINQGRDLPTEEIHRALLRLYLEGIVQLTVLPPKAVLNPSELPCASALARLQAETLDEVTNLSHEVVILDDLSRNVLLLADGTRTTAEIAAELEKRGVVALRDAIRIPLLEATTLTLSAIAGQHLLVS